MSARPLFDIPEGWRLLEDGEQAVPSDYGVSKKGAKFSTRWKVGTTGLKVSPDCLCWYFRRIEPKTPAPVAKVRVDPAVCDHADPEIVTVIESKGWEVTFARCKCGLRGPGWSFAYDDDQGRFNARIEVESWWTAKMPALTSRVSVLEGVLKAIEIEMESDKRHGVSAYLIVDNIKEIIREIGSAKRGPSAGEGVV